MSFSVCNWNNIDQFEKYVYKESKIKVEIWGLELCYQWECTIGVYEIYKESKIKVEIWGSWIIYYEWECTIAVYEIWTRWTLTGWKQTLIMPNWIPDWKLVI